MAKIQTIKELINGEEVVVKVFAEGFDLLTNDDFVSYIFEKLLVIHHNDLDGKCGAALFNAIADRHDDSNVRYSMNEYRSNPFTLDNFKEEDKNGVVVLVDYSLPIETLKEVVKDSKLVIFLDHHDSAIRVVMNNFEWFSQMVEEGKIYIDLDIYRCGTKIASEFLGFHIHDTNWNEYVINLVDNYDRWTGEFPEANYLNKYFYEHASTYIGAPFWDKLLFDGYFLHMQVLSVGEALFKLDIERNEIKYTAFSKEIENFHDLRIRAFEGYGNSQVFGDHINDYDAVCVYHPLKDGKWYYSLYTVKDIKLNIIAESYGGGGHAKACGFTIDRNLFE